MAILCLLLYLWLTNSLAQNILIIYCDDAGKEIGPYKEWTNGNDIKTPNIDYLANHSMVFNYAYTAVSSCSPSRSAMLTGLPVHQNGMYGLQQGVHHFQSFDANASDHITQYPLSIPRILKNNDYYTGIIGKYHVRPFNVYPFDYMRTESNGYSLNQVGRNITKMKELMIDFFDNQVPQNKSWLLYMAFFDTHRGCGGPEGPFCNHWGNGTGKMGTIPDWKPVTYNPNTIKLPYWMPDTPEARQDYVAYLEAYSRLDQGVGLFVNELKQRGFLNDTIIFFSSDNGECFPSCKTNLYEEGQMEPFMISIPELWTGGNNGPIYTDYLASNMDILPTILEYANIKYESYSLNGKQVSLTGHSLLDVVKNKQTTNSRPTNIFGSHIFHSIYIYYPMRIARNENYRLIHNLNWQAPYHILGDLYSSATWQTLLKDVANNEPTNWYKNLTDYYFRPEWELFDMNSDRMQLNNLAYNSQYKNIFEQMSKNLSDWLDITNDPWRNCNQNYEC